MKKTVAIHITPVAIRIAEGCLSGAKLRITRTALIPDSSDYFTDGKLDHLAEMANSIVKAMKESGMKAKSLAICYDNHNDIAVEWVEGIAVEEKKRRMKFREWLHSDAGKKKAPEDDEAANKSETGLLTKRTGWGQYITESESGVLTSITTADRDLISGIAWQFEELGYHVDSIESPSTALLYLHHAAPYNYDSMVKLLIQANKEGICTVYRWTKDIPAQVTERPTSPDDGDLPSQILAVCQREALAGSGLRRPLIMLGGDLLNTYSAYNAAAEKLGENGYSVLDIYNCHFEDTQPNQCVDNSLKVEICGNRGNENVCGQFTACIGLLLRALESTPCDLITRKDLMKTNSAALKKSAYVMFAAVIVLAASVAATGLRIVGTNKMKAEIVSDAVLNGNLATAVANRQGMQDRIAAMDGIDSRYKGVLTYALGTVNSSLNIASIDTENVLDETTSASKFSSDATTGTAATTSGTEGETQGAADPAASGQSSGKEETTLNLASRQKIIIRGYANSSGTAMDFYNSLMSTGIGSVELVGIQQVKLEDNREDQSGKKIADGPTETIYAFEVTVGGGK